MISPPLQVSYGRIRNPPRRQSEATLSLTGVNSNVQAPSRGGGATTIVTPACLLSLLATPEWKTVQPLSERFVLELLP